MERSPLSLSSAGQLEQWLVEGLVVVLLSCLFAGEVLIEDALSLQLTVFF